MVAEVVVKRVTHRSRGRAGQRGARPAMQKAADAMRQPAARYLFSTQCEQRCMNHSGCILTRLYLGSSTLSITWITPFDW